MTRLVPLAGLLAVLGCEQAKPTADPVKTPATAASGDDDHEHGTGPNGGTVFDFGKHHAEFCMDHGKKQATVYILSGNLKRNVAVAADTLTVSLKRPKLDVPLKAAPLDNDPPGKASRFVGTHEAFGVEQEFAGTVHGQVDGKPFAGDFQERPDAGHEHGRKPRVPAPAMPAAARGDEEARRLYQTPGGAYTAADVTANGPLLPAAKFKGVRATHNLEPAAGDRLCPITRTKANPAFAWVIGGKTYEVCCPPCLDELVQLAKDKPGELKDPEAYRKK